ncbi:MAG: acetyl-CoA carboxylase biotin carboxylase subunit [Vulcanimicrobiota bacterium]
MFSKVFVANRGEIACRVIRACRTLGVQSVLGFHEVDRASLGVRLADFSYPLQTAPGESPRAAYLDIEQIVEAARKSGCQAVHPGYGFLSERAEFSEACRQAGLTFIGPEPECITRLGDKNQAREVMKSAGLPLVPGSDGPCESLEQALEIATGMGYPVLIKAAGGGGGRGMRRAYSEEELKVGFEQAKREALASFGNDSVYLEKYIARPRHIEIQILADNHGNVIHLGERECSVQRRFQKMLEEAPSPFLDEKTRQAMGTAAVEGARAAGYRGVGTFEFLVDENKNFYFLEVNTRLQVEHPVTEEVTGVDLVCEQLWVANGEKLRLSQDDIVCRGWSIECRITCEDPDLNFTPAVGQVRGLRLPAGPGVRVDTHLYEGYKVPNDFDSMLAKLIVTGSDREATIGRALGALGEFELAGFPTSIPFHRWLLQHPRFAAGDFSTHFLEEEFQGLPDDGTQDLDLLTVAAVVKHQNTPRPSLNGQSANWARSSRLSGLRT